jgi:hypothetical protein
LSEEATPELRFQSTSQRENNSITVCRALFVEDLTANAVANAPVKQRKPAIHGARDLLPALEDQIPHLIQTTALDSLATYNCSTFAVNETARRYQLARRSRMV